MKCLKHHMEYFNIQCKIQLDHPVGARNRDGPVGARQPEAGPLSAVVHCEGEAGGARCDGDGKRGRHHRPVVQEDARKSGSHRGAQGDRQSLEVEVL